MSDNENGPNRSASTLQPGPSPLPEPPGRGYHMVPNEVTPGRPADQAKIALIRSIAGHAAGREADALIDIAAVLSGVTLEELAAVRAGAA
jgi:hypothetical protein